MLLEKSSKAGERTHQPISQITATVGLAQVRKSTDPTWPKWAVIYPSKPTRWFDTEQQAEAEKLHFNS